MEIVTENATSLAWIGDAVMSLAVREHLLSLGYRKAHVLQKKNAVICSAKGQSVMLNTMMDEDFFTEDEKKFLHVEEMRRFIQRLKMRHTKHT